MEASGLPLPNKFLPFFLFSLPYNQPKRQPLEKPTSSLFSICLCPPTSSLLVQLSCFPTLKMLFFSLPLYIQSQPPFLFSRPFLYRAKREGSFTQLTAWGWTCGRRKNVQEASVQGRIGWGHRMPAIYQLALGRGRREQCWRCDLCMARLEGFSGQRTSVQQLQ